MSLDPQLWMADHVTNGLNEMKTLIQHFTDPLQLQVLRNKKDIYVEWPSLQTTIKASFIHSYIHLEYQHIWEKIFVYQHREVPNICMAHKTMEDCILIAGNKIAWNKKERRKFSTMLPENISV